ncbi:MAG: BlaI/MecI/CopY family transcriptional regulator [Eubacterium sp.]|nr:BlaI/MecI/CopY family transcriptional regulator [Eubacterium sp.]MDE6155017.1 BlaI/MecI/CopY family transcriptional regulator [Eubacterium sp.]
MDELKLCESDFRFMCVIWENEPLSSRRLVELCAQKIGWKKSTTYTTLKKLCDKGFAQNINTVVTSLVAKDDVQAYAGNKFIENTFAGSLPNFLVSFLGSKKISDEEAAELKKLIDEYKE